MAEHNLIYAGAGAIFTSLLAFFGWSTKRAHDKIDAFPEKYVMKPDYNKDQNVVRHELRGMREDFKSGMKEMQKQFTGGVNRIYDKMEGKQDK